MKKSGFVIIFLIGAIVILSIVKVVLYNRISTSGVFLSKIEKEISYYKTENAILSEKLLISSSLKNVAGKAKELGFIKNDSLRVLKTSNSVALKQ